MPRKQSNQFFCYFKRKSQCRREYFRERVFGRVKHDGAVEPRREPFGQDRVRSGLEGGGAHEGDLLQQVLLAGETVIP